MATQLVRALSGQDCELVVFSRTPSKEIERLFSQEVLAKTRFFLSSYEWKWGKWYSRDRRIAFIASLIKRVCAGEKLIASLLAEHARKPFDVIVQFSQIELLGLRKHAAKLPIVIYPCVHAEGELRACIEEESIARQCEPWWWRLFRRFHLGMRSRIQARDLRLAKKIVGMSNIFNGRLRLDYRLDQAKFGVVYQPIQLGKICPTGRRNDGLIRLLFVGRISVRKGIELLLEAAPHILCRYSDVTITIVGGASLWSDYEPLLRNLPQGLLWKGNLEHHQAVSEMENSDILIVPSHYEPGGIVVGEALAAGMLIVASDVVGSAEVLSEEVCSRFTAGFLPGLIQAIDLGISRVRSDRNFRLAARNECEKHFTPSRIARSLLNELESLLR